MRIRLLTVLSVGLFLAASAYAANGVYNVVTDYSAAGDGTTDDTTAFQNALNQASSDGGGKVIVPVGTYRIATHLSIPAYVALEGLNRGPSQSGSRGSVLWAEEYEGTEAATPFITLNTTSQLRGLSIFYPNQAGGNPPDVYPYTILGYGDNMSIIDVTLINSYLGVDFGSVFSGREFIDGLYGQCFKVGLWENFTFDVCRVNNVNFGPYWTTGGAYTWQRANGVAFKCEKIDGDQFSNWYCKGYDIGVQLKEGTYDAYTGAGAARLVNLITEECSVPVHVWEVMEKAGWGISNGIIEGEILSWADNAAEFIVAGLAFKPLAGQPNYIQTNGGTGIFGIYGCSFPAFANTYVYLENDYTTVVSNAFQGTTASGTCVDVRSACSDTVVAFNRMEEGERITHSGGELQSGINAGLSSVTPPNAPTNLSATGVSDTQVDLVWTDNATDETGFKIERSSTSGSGYGQIGTNPADDTTYSDTGLSKGTVYWYRVRAYNAGGDSAYSNEDDGTTTSSGCSSAPMHRDSGSFLAMALLPLLPSALVLALWFARRKRTAHSS
ncbi:MAG TPA: hypothetical protein HPP83_05400 [Candidatus Hydrogenedentes bacterium]|nr:hypothetical protein [Candidatus Hydrogenedentota bacterium]